MKLPTEELKEAYERYKAMSSSVNKEEDDFFNTVGSFRGDSKDAMFNLRQKSKQVEKKSFFASLEGKSTKDDDTTNY